MERTLTTHHASAQETSRRVGVALERMRAQEQTDATARARALAARRALGLIDQAGTRRFRAARAEALICSANALGDLALQAPLRTAVGRLRAAGAAYDAAIRLYRGGRNDAEQRAAALYNKGTLFAELAERLPPRQCRLWGEQALASLRAAGALYAHLGYEDDCAWALNNAANARATLASVQPRAVQVRTLRRALRDYAAALAHFQTAAHRAGCVAVLQNCGHRLVELAEVAARREQRPLLLRALSCYRDALTRGQEELSPPDRAMIQHGLANAYRAMATRSVGEARSEALEQARVCLMNAVETFQAIGEVADWKRSLIGLATILREAARDAPLPERKQQLGDALIHCHDALTPAEEEPPTPFADAVAALATLGAVELALADLLTGPERRLALRDAVEAFTVALPFYRATSADVAWARGLSDRGVALYALAQDVLATDETQGKELLWQAESCFLRALRKIAPAAPPLLWGTIQGHLGDVARLRATSATGPARRRLLQQAQRRYRNALSDAPLRAAPRQRRDCARALAQTFLQFALDRWRELHSASAPGERGIARALDNAWEAARIGLQAANAIERSATTRDQRMVIWAEQAPLYALAAAIQTQRRRPVEAVRLLERGRARVLAELRDARMAQETTDAIQGHLEASSRPVRDGGRGLRDLAALAGPGEGFVYLIPLELGTQILLVAADGVARARWLPELTADALLDLVAQPDARGYYQLGYLPAIMRRGAQRLEETIERLLPALGDQLMAHVARLAQEARIRRLILIPGGMLTTLPLHAAAYPPLSPSDAPTAPGGRRYACDDFLFSYAPSAAVYQAARVAATRLDPPQQALVVGNPQLTSRDEPWTRGVRGYLPYATREASRVCALMRAAGLTVTRLLNADASLQRVVAELERADLAHLAVHGHYDGDDPLAASLLLARRARWGLADLLDPQQGALSHLRLVILSGCQTGLHDIMRLREEGWGLYGGLLAAGVGGVIGSLWPVYDRSTVFLMEAFTRRYLCTGQEPALALHNAMRAVRGLADEEGGGAGMRVSAFASSEHATTGQETEQIKPVHSGQSQWGNERRRSPAAMRHFDAPPRSRAIPAQRTVSLAHPVHWAPFIYYGA